MYQIKTNSRYEIQVIGKTCRIEKDLATQFTGSYRACVKWLADRGIKTI